VAVLEELGHPDAGAVRAKLRSRSRADGVLTVKRID
jgi:hypothetical protein